MRFQTLTDDLGFHHVLRMVSPTLPPEKPTRRRPTAMRAPSPPADLRLQRVSFPRGHRRVFVFVRLRALLR